MFMFPSFLTTASVARIAGVTSVVQRLAKLPRASFRSVLVFSAPSRMERKHSSRFVAGGLFCPRRVEFPGSTSVVCVGVTGVCCVGAAGGTGRYGAEDRGGNGAGRAEAGDDDISG